ncbi:MAG: hypothetical protein U0575_09610 [Phycisphaerales bacterium]
MNGFGLRWGRVGLLAIALGAAPFLASCDSASKVEELTKSVGLDPTQLVSKLGASNADLSSLSGALNDVIAKAGTDPKGAIDKLSAAAKSFSGNNNAISSALGKLTEGGNTDMLKSWLGSAGSKATPEQLKGLTDTIGKFTGDSSKFQSMLTDVTGKLMKNPTADGISGLKGAIGNLDAAKGGLSGVTDSLTKQFKGVLGM